MEYTSKLMVVDFDSDTPSRPMVPQSFVTLLRLTLSKMSANSILDPGLITADFWSAWSQKFTSAAAYDARKKRRQATFEMPAEVILVFSSGGNLISFKFNLLY